MTHTLTASILAPFAWLQFAMTRLRAGHLQRQTRSQLDMLDDRLRRDIGLEPTGMQPTSAANAAARIAMMASR